MEDLCAKGMSLGNGAKKDLAQALNRNYCKAFFSILLRLLCFQIVAANLICLIKFFLCLKIFFSRLRD